MSRRAYAILSLPLICFLAGPAAAQSSCPNGVDPTNATQPQHERHKAWELDQSVRVHIPGELTPCSSQIWAALRAWETSLANIWGVRFNPGGSGVRGAGQLNFKWQAPPVEVQSGEEGYPGAWSPFNSDGSNATGGEIYLHPGFLSGSVASDCQRVAELTAHETGHSMGLANCGLWCHGQSAMAGWDPNKPSGITGPTEDDIEQVNCYWGDPVREEREKAEVTDDQPAGGDGGDTRLREANECYLRTIYRCPWNYTNLNQCVMIDRYIWCY